MTPSWLAIKEFSVKLISSEVHHNLVKQQSRVKEDGPYWKVLLIDDDPDIIQVTRLSLRNFNFADWA